MKIRCVMAAAAALCCGLATSSALAQSYVTSGAPVAIPDNTANTLTSGANVVLNIPDSIVITDLNVMVSITHTFDSDVDFFLEGPDGKIIELSTDNGSSSDNYKNTIFDDSAATAITSGAAPFRNKFRPEGVIAAGFGTVANLAAFNGTNAMGNWTLHVKDDLGGDVGTLDYFAIMLNGFSYTGGNTLTTNTSTSPSPSQVGLNIAIPDNTGVAGTSTTVVPAADNAIISDVDVFFSTTHADLSQLRAELVHPNGTTIVQLHAVAVLAGSSASPTTDGGTPSTANRPYTSLCDDQAAASIATGSAPYRGRFQCDASGALAAFNGLASQGTWTLRVFDNVTGTTGTLREWALHLRGTTPPGACCRNDGTCTIEANAGACPAGGLYQGNGSVCSGANNTCPVAVGSCCNNTTGVCTYILASATCTGGTFTPGGVCSPNTCPPGGSCCMNQCCNVTLQSLCPAPAVWTLGGSCSPTNPCTTVPPNDLCSNAIALTLGTPAIGGNCGATNTGDGPSATCNTTPNNAVWYTFTPANSGFFNISACGANFDSVLAVFTTPDCTNFTQVTGGCDDDACAGGEPGPFGTTGAGTASIISNLGLCGGTTYYIRMSSFTLNSTGTFPLLVSTGSSTTGACCNDLTGACTSTATQAACETAANFHFQGAGTVCCPGLCPQPSGACCKPDGTCSVIQAAACTTAGGLFQGPATMCGSMGECPVGVGSCCNNTTGVCTYILASATCTGGTFTLAGVCSPDTCPKPGRCCIAGCCTFVLQANCTGSWTAGGSCTPNPCGGPANDLCSGATAVTVGANPGTNACASTDFVITPETACGTTTGAGGARDVWHTFTPTQSANYTFSTCNATGFDSTLALYGNNTGTNTCPASGTVVPRACNDDTAGTCSFSTLRSEIPNQLLFAGQTYFIRVAAWGGGTAEGPYVLTITQGAAAGACCTGTSCAIVLGFTCTTPSVYQGDFSTCGPNTCDPIIACCFPDGSCTPTATSQCATPASSGTCTPNNCPQPNGACCCGSTCSMTAPGACTGTNTMFAGSGTTCNAFGVNNTNPCCFADYNHSGAVGVQDIFDFLAAYFSQDACADINVSGPPPSVQDIFDFLAAYFAGCP